MKEKEATSFISLVKECQGLPTELVPNKPFQISLADLLWIDQEKENYSPLNHPITTTITSSNHSPSSSSSSSSSDSFHSLSKKDFDTYSFIPLYVPSKTSLFQLSSSSSSSSLQDLNIITKKTTENESLSLITSVPTTPTTTTTNPTNPTPATTTITTTASGSTSTLSSTEPSQMNNLPPSFHPIPDPRLPNTSSIQSKPLISSISSSQLTDPRLNPSRIPSFTHFSPIAPSKCPSPPLSSTNSPSSTSILIKEPVEIHSEKEDTIQNLSLPIMVKQAFNSTNTTSSSILSNPSIGHVHSVYSKYVPKSNNSSELTNSTEPYVMYSTLTQKEHATYLALDKKKKESLLTETEKIEFGHLHDRVEAEQENYTKYIKGLLMQSSTRYLNLSASIEKTMIQFLRHQQKRRSFYPPCYVSKKSWKPLSLYKELKNVPVPFKPLKVVKEVVHTPADVKSPFLPQTIPFDFLPDLNQCPLPMSKDPIMARLIPTLPEVQFMLTSGTFSKLVQLSHDFYLSGHSKLDLLFPITIHRKVICIDKPLPNHQFIPRELMQKYFSIALRSLTNKKAPSTYQFSTFQLGPFTLLVRKQWDAPQHRLKCNVEYFPELGLEALDSTLLAGYTLKELLEMKVNVARIHSSTGAVLQFTPTSSSPAPMYFPFLMELFHYLLNLSDGYYILATRPGDAYIYILQQFIPSPPSIPPPPPPSSSSSSSSSNTTTTSATMNTDSKDVSAPHLDLRTWQVHLSSVPSLRMLMWKEKPGQIPYTFPFAPPFTTLPSSSSSSKLLPRSTSSTRFSFNPSLSKKSFRPHLSSSSSSSSSVKPFSSKKSKVHPSSFVPPSHLKKKKWKQPSFIPKSKLATSTPSSSSISTTPVTSAMAIDGNGNKTGIGNTKKKKPRKKGMKKQSVQDPSKSTSTISNPEKGT